MKDFLKFFSITTATQIVLAINQLILLPLQLRVWGQVEAAHWLVALAVANLCSISDLGLRSVGHAQLLSCQREGSVAAGHYFHQVWAMARVVMAGVTIVVIAASAWPAIAENATFRIWPFILIVTLFLDTVLIVRGYWLDTLGQFRRVEGLFFCMVACRNSGALLALWVFHAGPAVLAAVMLGTGVAALTGQTYWLGEPKSLALFLPVRRELTWNIAKLIPLAIADPLATWIRFSLPVMILANMTSPENLAIFVAMRALFSLGRQIINQLGRFASIRFVEYASSNATKAETVLGSFLLLATLLASALSYAIIADHGRVLAFWFHLDNARLEPYIALSFAIGATGNAFQVIAASQMRLGRIKQVASCQYIYIALSLAAAVLGYWSDSTLIYLALLAFQEVFIGVVFAACLRGQLLRVNTAAFLLALISVPLFWLAVNISLDPLFQQKTLMAISEAMLAGVICIAILTSAYIGIYELAFGLPRFRYRRR